MMVIKEGRRTMPIAWVHTLPATFEGQARMMVQNAMAAAAAAHVAGAHLHDIRQGLRSFTTSIYQAPGRLNVFDLDGVKVVLDYAHNAAGLETLATSSNAWRRTRATGERPGEASWSANLRVAVVATAGDRRDEDMKELGRVAAKYFDEVIVREDTQSRGREPGETAALILEGVGEGSEGRRARRQRRGGARRDGRRAPGPRPRRAPATWWSCASTTPPRSTRRSSSAAGSPRPRCCARPRAISPTRWAATPTSCAGRDTGTLDGHRRDPRRARGQP